MISFFPTVEEKAFIQVAESIVKEKIHFRERMSEKSPVLDEGVIVQLRDLGFLSMELPEEWGGLELPLVTQSLIWQALSRGDLESIQSLPGAGEAASLLRLLPGSMELDQFKKKFMENPHSSISFLDSEKDLWGDDLKCHRVNDGYILQGKSIPVQRAAFSRLLLVAAKDDHGDTVLFYADQPEHWQVSGENRLGLKAAGIGRIQFQDYHVSESHLLAKGNVAEEILRKARARIYIIEAAKEVGLAEAALEYAIEYTAVRKAFGEPIAAFQGVSFRVADMAIEVSCARNLMLEAAYKADQDSREAEVSAIRALSRAHRAVRFNTDAAVQLLGGHGFVSEYPAEKWMRDARAQVSLYPGERVQLLELGKKLVGAEKDGIFT